MAITTTRRAALLGTATLAGATVLGACAGNATKVDTPDTGEAELKKTIDHPAADELTIPDEENPLTERGGILVGADMIAGESVPDVPVIRIYSDYLCPHCAAFSELHDEDLASLVSAGQATLEFVNIAFIHEYSLRAAAMSLAASIHMPEQWWDLHSALFAEQPTGQDASSQPTLSHLNGIAEGAGIDSVTRDTFTSKDYLTPVMTITKIANDAGITSTPSVFIDSEQVEPEALGEPGAISALVLGEQE